MLTREEKALAGLCTECGTSVPRPGYRTCSTCTDRRNARKATRMKTDHGRAICVTIVDAIRAHAKETHRSPTVRELSVKVGLSKAALHAHLRWLRERGYVEWDEGLARTLRVLRSYRA